LLSSLTISIQRIPWIQNGVRDPEQWLQETAPNTNTRVVVTDEDTKRALKTARFSYPGWVARITKPFKRVPLPLIPSSRTSDRIHSKPDDSLGRARSSRARAAMDRQLKRFAFGNPSPTRASTLPASHDHRRNSLGGHPQSISDPSSHIRHDHDAGPSTRRSIAMHAAGTRAWSNRRQLESLNLPGSSISVCLTPSPTTPDEQQPVAGGTLKERLTQVIRSSSVKKAVQGVRGTRSLRNAERAPRTRTSAETFDVLRPSEDLGLTPAMRASSWGSPYAAAASMHDDASFDRTVSEAGGGVQDFNKSVVRFGAGGYVEAGAYVDVPAANIPMGTPGAGSSRGPFAGMTHSDSSSNSTATATTATTQHLQQQNDDAARAPRVTSPLAQDGESEGELSSVFDDHEPDSSDDDVIELRSRRPSAILSRSANTSPLR
jgi:hypothetical protein